MDHGKGELRGLSHYGGMDTHFPSAPPSTFRTLGHLIASFEPVASHIVEITYQSNFNKFEHNLIILASISTTGVLLVCEPVPGTGIAMPGYLSVDAILDTRL